MGNYGASGGSIYRSGYAANPRRTRHYRTSVSNYIYRNFHSAISRSLYDGNSWDKFLFAANYMRRRCGVGGLEAEKCKTIKPILINRGCWEINR